MISVYGAFVSMQAVVPFHASLKDSHKLPIYYMVPSFHWGELLAEVRHRALLLQQLCAQALHRCIAMHLQWFDEVRLLQHRCQSQLGF